MRFEVFSSKEEIDWRFTTMYHLDEDAASILS